MKCTLLILRRAEIDVERIYRWLAKRSLTGALRWREAYVYAITDLTQNPMSFGYAEEAGLARRQVRQRMFRTPHGRNYRISFMVSGNQVRILRVRGPSEPLLRQNQIRG